MFFLCFLFTMQFVNLFDVALVTDRIFLFLSSLFDIKLLMQHSYFFCNLNIILEKYHPFNVTYWSKAVGSKCSFNLFFLDK
jgi:hypothetical protein